MTTTIEISEELATFDLPELPSLEATLVEQKVNEVPEGEPVTLTDEEFAEITAEAARIDGALEALTARKEELKAIARRLDYGKNERESSLGSISIGHNKQFDKAEFAEAYPFDHYAIEDYVTTNENGNKVVRQRMVFPNRPYYKIEANGPLAKKFLSAEEYEKFYHEGTKKVAFNK